MSHTPSSLHICYLEKLTPQHSHHHLRAEENETEHRKNPAQGHKPQSSWLETELKALWCPISRVPRTCLVVLTLLKSDSLSWCLVSWSPCGCFISTLIILRESASQPTSRICGVSRVDTRRGHVVPLLRWVWLLAEGTSRLQPLRKMTTKPWRWECWGPWPATRRLQIAQILNYGVVREIQKGQVPSLCLITHASCKNGGFMFADWWVWNIHMKTSHRMLSKETALLVVIQLSLIILRAMKSVFLGEHRPLPLQEGS